MYYSAIKKFSKVLRDPNNEYWIDLNEDQVLIFDNFRLLHGRSQIKGNRTLVTAYLSRDDYQSKLSVCNNINDF
jgi:trimethyllysine dioxygenase